MKGLRLEHVLIVAIVAVFVVVISLQYNVNGGDEIAEFYRKKLQKYFTPKKVEFAKAIEHTLLTTMKTEDIFQAEAEEILSVKPTSSPSSFVADHAEHIVETKNHVDAAAASIENEMIGLNPLGNKKRQPRVYSGHQMKVLKSICANPQTPTDFANCGTLFQNIYDGQETERSGTRVAVWGDFHKRALKSMRWLSGCPIRSSPLHPTGGPECLNDSTCAMYQANSTEDLHIADVVLLQISDVLALTRSNELDVVIPRFKSGSKLPRYRVLFVREPSKIPKRVYEGVDLIMGTYLWHDIRNPNFYVRPIAMVEESERYHVSFSEKVNFAMSVISHCEPTRSRRGLYIDALVARLGASKIHQFGKCGDGHVTPKKPVSAMEELTSKYKFYLAFENTIADGYSTEKFFKILTFGVLPVYMGPLHPPRVTKQKSYINVHDFSSPESLADYLEYLAKNETAYEEYHLWRKLPAEEAFDPEYLEIVSRHLVSREEYAKIDLAYQEYDPSPKIKPLRIAACCTLCNRKYLAQLVANRKPQQYLSPWKQGQIFSKLFGRNPLNPSL